MHTKQEQREEKKLDSAQDAALFQTLNKAAATLQRSAHNEQEFIRVFCELILSLGFHGSISLLNKTNTFLTVKAIAYPSRLIKYLEEITGFTATGFIFRVEKVDLFRDIVEKRKSFYIPDSIQIIEQLLPGQIKSFRDTVQKAIAGLPVIYAPLISAHKIMGILAIVGKNLKKTDIPAIEAFANQIAAALDNFSLLKKLKTNEEKLRQQTEDLRLINELNEALNLGKPMYKIFSLLSQETRHIFSCKGVAIYLYNPNNNELVLQNINPPSIIAESIEQLTGVSTKNLRIGIKPQNLYQVIIHDKNYHLLNKPRHIRQYVNEFIESIILFNETTRKKLMEFLTQIIRMINVHSIIIFPMIAGDDTIGFIEISKEEYFTEEDIYRLETISRQLTSAIKRKQNEDQLQRLSHAIKQSPSMIVITDINGNIEYINSKFTEVTGYSFKEVYGKHVRLLKSGKTSPAQYTQLWQTITAGGEWRGEFYNRRKNGELYWEEANISPIRDSIGEIIYYLAVKNDITEKRKIEEELFKARKLDSIGILAGGIAHDFNNLLSGVLGNINLAKIQAKHTHNELNKELLSLLEDAERASVIAKDLTQQLLTFSRGGTPVKKTVSLMNLIKETVRFALRGSNVKWEVLFPDDLWPVEIDKGQMNQVINNLVINADQAMKDGGMLYISARNVFINKDNFFPLQEGEYVIISFKDQGEGIPEQNISKIFDPYFTTKENGNGLGLSTSYSIIKKHGGIILVESEQGVGSTFFVYLPAVDKPLDEKKTEKKMSLPPCSRILVMDDEKLVRKVAVKMLKRLGFETAEVKNGDEAIQAYKKSLNSPEMFDLVIMDLTIPGGMGGEEAVKGLRAINPGIKVIVSSGYSNDPIMAHYKEYGFDGIVTKPYKLNELKAAILQVLFPDDSLD